MLNSKFDINGTEWLDIVFEKRNKSYGAYDLRKHSGDNMVKAFAIVLFSLAVILASTFLFSQKKASVGVKKGAKVESQAVYVFNKYIPNHTQPKDAVVEPVSAITKHTPVSNSGAVKKTISHTPKQPVAVAQVPVAPVINNVPQINANTPVDDNLTDVKPAPLGGAQAWSDFLEQNLRYPTGAKEDRISGKVWVSFIVERDGHITNVVIDRPAGHGFDEEATRVISLSPTWTPGIQNGQTVRVKYSLPVNFQIER